jgi:hypothetical protein
MRTLGEWNNLLTARISRYKLGALVDANVAPAWVSEDNIRNKTSSSESGIAQGPVRHVPFAETLGRILRHDLPSVEKFATVYVLAFGKWCRFNLEAHHDTVTAGSGSHNLLRSFNL